MTEASAIVLLVFSIVTYLWAVVGLIKPGLARLPNRLVSVLVWAVSFGMFIFGIALLPAPQESKNPLTLSPAEPPVVVSSAELLRAFTENEIRADQTYGGRVLEVTGTINSIEGDIFGDGGFIEFQGGEFWTDVQAHYSDGSVLASLSRGQSISVVCRDVDGGNIMGVWLSECEVPRIGTGGTSALHDLEDARAQIGTVGVEPGTAAACEVDEGALPSTAGRNVSESSDMPLDAEVATAPPRLVLPEELLQAFEENEVHAEQTYRGQRLQLTGLVGGIEGDVLGDGGFIEFQGGGFLREVEAHFRDRSDLMALSRHERVTVVCRDVDGSNIMGVRLSDCELSRMEAALVYSAALQADPERVDRLFRFSLMQMRAGAEDAARESFGDLLDAGVPLELAATHDHAFGDCEGLFTLTSESVSYRSPREEDPDHRFEVPLNGVVEAGLRGESLWIRAPSAEHVEKNEGDSKNWTFRFDVWNANAEVGSLIAGHLSARR